jgi:hypothetical protein
LKVKQCRLVHPIPKIRQIGMHIKDASTLAGDDMRPIVLARTGCFARHLTSSPSI